MIRAITVSGPRYVLKASGSYKLVRVRTPQRRIAVTHMVAHLGGGDTIPMTAGENLSALRVVMPSPSGAIYADASSILTSKLLGITTTSATAGQAVQVKVSGIVSDALWSWVPNDTIWLGSNGMLTSIPPSSGVAARVGIAMTATSIAIQIHQPIVLS